MVACCANPTFDAILTLSFHTRLPTQATVELRPSFRHFQSFSHSTTYLFKIAALPLLSSITIPLPLVTSDKWFTLFLLPRSQAPYSPFQTQSPPKNLYPSLSSYILLHSLNSEYQLSTLTHAPPAGAGAGLHDGRGSQGMGQGLHTGAARIDGGPQQVLPATPSHLPPDQSGGDRPVGDTVH